MVEWTGKPAYQQVADDLRRRIAAGEFAQSEKLPSLSELQDAYGATVTVARDAIRQLKTDGLAVSHQGKGAFSPAMPRLRPGWPTRARPSKNCGRKWPSFAVRSETCESASPCSKATDLRRVRADLYGPLS